MRDATTGVPAAKASATTMGSPSYQSDGTATAKHRAMAAATSARPRRPTKSRPAAACEGGGERAFADRAHPGAGQGGRVRQHRHALLGAEAADVEEARAGLTLGPARVGQPVGFDGDARGRQAGRDEARFGEGRERDETVHLQRPGSGPAMDVDHPGDRDRPQAGASVAAVKGRVVRRARHAVLAGPAVAGQQRARAGDPVIVQRLHGRGAARPDGPVHARGDQGERIVDVDDIGPEPVRRRDDARDAARVVSRVQRDAQPVERRADLVVARQDEVDEGTGPRQGRGFALDDGVLAPPDLIPVVDDEDARAAASGRRLGPGTRRRHRRGQPHPEGQVRHAPGLGQLMLRCSWLSTQP